MSGGSAASGAGEQDRALLRRATWVVAAQTGGAVAVVVALVVGLVYLTSLEARRDAIESKARAKVAAAEATGAGGSVVADGLPSECPETEVEAAAAGLPLGETWFEVCDGPFLGYVDEADGERTAAVVSFVEQRDETRRLAQLSLLAGLVGVLAAAGLGWVSARRAVRPLGEALSLQRRFVADAGHELRTPLAILLTRAQMLHRTASDTDQREELRLLVDDARVMGDVVGDLLLVAELRDRRTAYETVDLVGLAHEVRAAFAATADASGVGMDVLAPEAPVEIDGAPAALRRAVTALVDNSLAHVSPGGTVQIRVAGASDGLVSLAVLDDGTGLDPGDAEDLTQRFHRGLVPDGEGQHRLGLGLSLVREIVEAHGGRLQIDGSPSRGAAVTLHLRR